MGTNAFDVGHSLDPGTTEVTIKALLLSNTGRRLFLVDTPGFEYSSLRTVAQVFEMAMTRLKSM